MHLGAPGDGKTDIKVILQAFKLGAGLLQNRKLGECGVTRGYN